MKIKHIKAREILDSRGNPTIETEMILEDGSVGIASVPSGAIVSRFEVLELRDQDPDRFNGLGVLKAVEKINNFIAPKLIGLDAAYQAKIDELLYELDGSDNLKNLGGNTVLSVSQANLEASAASYRMPIYAYLQVKYQLGNKESGLPAPIFNIINGGKHGAGNLNFQEFLIIPTVRKAYHEALECGQEIYKSLEKALIYRGAIHSTGVEGGFAPNLFTNTDALEIMSQAIEDTKYQLTRDVFLGLDVAADFFYKNGRYLIKDRAEPFSSDDFIEYYIKLNKEYSVFSLEDPFYQDDWKSWKRLTEMIGENTMIVGDDLLCTNKERLSKAISQKACTAALIKPNQRGTITKTLEVIQLAKKSNLKTIISHRSGETNDDFMADFAYGVGADYIKFGAPSRGERVVKYNRLLKIEDEISQQPNTGLNK
ncbi:phosphopyruvate hydratase [Patescibacteria group bacterium]